MYKVRATKHIHYGYASYSTRDLFLIKDFELPFPPFTGLHIEGVLDDNTIISTYVTFNVEEQLFYITTEEDETRYNQHMEARRRGLSKTELTPFREIVEAYLSDGWEMKDGDKIAGEDE